MENAIRLLSGELTQNQEKALELHYEIKKNGELAAVAMVEFCKGLKKMRDCKLYLELEFDSFEEYVEGAVGLKQRQAYTYIQALENLGEDVLQSNASLGITKLQILGEIPRWEREEFLESHDVEEMSTRELKDVVSKLHEAQEQLTFMTSERDRLQGQIELAAIGEKTVEELQEEIDEQQDLIAALKEELKEAKEKPTVVSVREPSAGEIKELTKDAIEKEKKKAEKEKQKAVAAAEKAAREDERKKATEELEKKYADALQTSDREKDNALARLSEMEKQAKLTANPEIIKFSFYFDEAQKNINEMCKIISQADEQTAEKLKKAKAALATKLQEG